MCIQQYQKQLNSNDSVVNPVHHSFTLLDAFMTLLIANRIHKKPQKISHSFYEFKKKVKNVLKIAMSVGIISSKTKKKMYIERILLQKNSKRMYICCSLKSLESTIKNKRIQNSEISHSNRKCCGKKIEKQKNCCTRCLLKSHNDVE
jgi:hypothetical protein